jgi:hypothetical protein
MLARIVVKLFAVTPRPALSSAARPTESWPKSVHGTFMSRVNIYI